MKETLLLPAEHEGAVWYNRNTGGRYHMHRHAELELNLVIQGTAVYLLDDRKYQLRRGTQVWLFPEQNHVLLEQSSDHEMWILVFRPGLVRRVGTNPAAAVLLDPCPAGHFCKQLAEKQLRRLNLLFGEIAAASGDAARTNAGLGYALTTAWAAQLAADVLPVVVSVHPAVERAVQLIRFETEPLRLAAIARHAGLSPSRLSRVFKEQTGVSLVGFRNRQRVERFLSLYGEGQRRTMMTAALDAGFGSYPQFHRVFKRVMGCSPAGYRRRMRTMAGEELFS